MAVETRNRERAARWRLRLAALAALALLAMTAGPASAGTLDQSADEDCTFCGAFVAANQTAAQTFTAGASGGLDQVDLELARIGDIGGPTLTVELRTVASGAPTGTVLATAAADPTTLPWGDGFTRVAVPFATAANVTAGEQYAIVVTGAGEVNGTRVVWKGATSDHYAGGEAYALEAGAFVPVSADHVDMAFRTYVAAEDTAPPSIAVSHTADGDNGWNTTASVRITVTAEDSGSGVAGEPRCTDNGEPLSGRIVAGEGLHDVTCSVSDTAGNTSSATDMIKIDSRAPTVTPTPADGSSYVLGDAVPAAGCTTADPGGAGTPATGSGVATEATATRSGGTPAGVGSFTVTCTGAIDRAGNAAAAVTASHHVRYDWRGFLAPVDDRDAAGDPIINRAKAGRTIPVRFSLRGNQGMGILAAGSPASTPVACDGGASVEAIEEYVGSSIGFRYDAVTDSYTYGWKTAGTWRGTCRELVVDLVDGSRHRVTFAFVR